MEFTRAFMVLALITSFLAAAWAVEWEHLFYCNFIVIPKALMASIWNSVTAISVLIALMMFEIESPHVPVKKTSSKGWAFYLSSVIGVLCFVIAHFDLSGTTSVCSGKEGHMLVWVQKRNTPPQSP
uniref:Uncharacterized protein n=1 Tax=Sphaerodactylus townsendi TaxID=933632 RepID=A0ACB8FSE6_9SAUR